MKIKWPKHIFSLSGKLPHPDYKGWKGFLETCEIRSRYRGVTYFGLTNCNYILFPNGLLVCNFGYHGHALMERIQSKGVVVTRKEIEKNWSDLLKTYAKLLKSP